MNPFGFPFILSFSVNEVKQSRFLCISSLPGKRSLAKAL